MNLNRLTASPKVPSARAWKWSLTLLLIGYALVASFAGWNIYLHTTASTRAIEQILLSFNMKNEGTLAVDRYSKEHPLLGALFGSPAKKELELPSHEHSAKALGHDVRQDLAAVRRESNQTAWWSWFLLNLSLVFLGGILLLGGVAITRPLIFSLTTISVIFFALGIFAPAMVIWTAPSIPMESGNLEFVLQHEVRGIAAIIAELFTTGHGIIGGFLLLFSILTPLTKASLTFFLAFSRSAPRNAKIGRFLHTIGKWSMADVFVAAVLLALFALKSQEATRSIPCLGLYYFIGYCLLSLATTELLAHASWVSGSGADPTPHRLGWNSLLGSAAALVCFFLASSYYTYQQYTRNLQQEVTLDSPLGLNNATLVLPGHK